MPPKKITTRKRSDAAKLRRQAEAMLSERKKKAAPLPTTEADTRRLVHELEVHQIELEMQNEELAQSRAEVEAFLRQYTDLYDFAPTGYFTLASDGTILAVNLTGASLLGIERSRLVNRRFGIFVSAADLPAFNTFLEKTFTGKAREFCEVTLQKMATSPLFVRIEAVAARNLQECRAAVLDITEHHQAEAEREWLIQELQEALARVKTLSGLLPMCANCKKIRDDQGYWNQVESYIENHSDATFTHGICPECIRKLYPELDDYYSQSNNRERASRQNAAGTIPGPEETKESSL